MQDDQTNIIALDFGDQRIGVALASKLSRMAQPLTTISNGLDVLQAINGLLEEHNASVVVVGMPRGLDGQKTAQTVVVEDFVEKLKHQVGLPVYWQDEALTSQKAEEELIQRGKQYSKGDIDALAATYILEDYLNDHKQELSE